MKETEQTEATALYFEKNAKFQDAIYNTPQLRGLVHWTTQDGYNDPEDQHWSRIFHKIKPGPTVDKETRLGYGFGGPDYSVILVFDHESQKTLLITGDFDPTKKEDYENRCRFAQYFSDKGILVAQFVHRLMLYLIDPVSLEIKETIDSRNSFHDYDHYFRGGIEKVIFDKNNLNYLAFIDNDGNPSLVQYNWDTGKVVLDSLPGYMTRFGSINHLFVKELEHYPIVVLGVTGKQNSDPDMGYSVFIQNGGYEKGMNLYNFKNEFFQSWTPRKFSFGEVDTDGFIQIDIYSRDILLTKTIVPTNMDFVRKGKEELQER